MKKIFTYILSLPLTFLSPIIFVLFIAYLICKFGEAILDFFSDRKKQINDDRLYILLLIKEMCNFNPYAKEEQFKLVDELCILTPEDNWNKLAPWASATKKGLQILKKMPLEEKRKYVNLLFKLAIARDGIKMDEWNFMMKVMKDVKLNKNWIQYFIKRYSPLRSEFEQQKEEEAPKAKPVTNTSKYFQILGIEPTSDITQIKKAYHAMALQFHPDMHQNAEKKEICEEKMAMINDAYEKVMAGL